MMKAVQYITISEAQAEQRIDNFLHTYLRSVPRSRVYSMLRKGEVRVNKRRVKPTHRLEPGDTLRIPPVTVQEKHSKPVSENLLSVLEQRIIYENKYLLVLNKPSGLAVHGGSGLSLGLIEAVRQLRPDCASLSLVHRLDRETSGCIIIAKKMSILRQLHRLLRERQLKKVYWMLVVGHWPDNLKEVLVPLQKNTLRSGQRVVQVDALGKDAITRFKVLKHFDGFSWVQAKPLTGRTHQIRVHAAHAGYPILGDDKYGCEVANKQMKQQCKSLCLHARHIAFELPDYELQVDVSAEVGDWPFLDNQNG